MKSKYSIQQLEELVNQFKVRVIPSIFDKKDELLQKIRIMQKENCLFSRSLYLLIYHLFINDNTKNITHEDLTIDILITDFEKIDVESCLGSFESQVFLNSLKQLSCNSRLFASSLITAKNENKSFQYILFSFSTFPAIFGYFSSTELCVQASLLLLDLISLNASDELLHPMIFSFLLSMHQFIDAFWNNFYLRLCNRSNVKEDDIMESMSHSISECSPLISAPIYLIMRELLLNRSNLLKDITVKSFLPITFHLWYTYSNYAMSFSFGSEVLSFLEKIADTQRGMMISSIFVTDTSRISTTPSFRTHCRFSSEVLFFSNIDLKLFVEAFSPISSQIQLFENLKEASKKLGEYPPFMPFPLDFFMNSAKAKFIDNCILNYPKVKVKRKDESSTEGGIFYIDDEEGIDKDFIIIEEPEPDPIFEAAKQELKQNSKLHHSTLFKSEKFQIFSLTKDLLDLIEMAEAQEFLISLKMQYNIAFEFQKSILNFRRYCFSNYISNYIKDINLDQIKDTLEEKMFVVLGDCAEKRLIIPAFLEVVNYSLLSNIIAPESMHDKFLSITRSFIEASWKLTGKLSTNKFVLNLVPRLSRRKNLNLGHYFYILDQLLKDVRTITSFYYKNQNIEDEMPVILQAVIYSSNTEFVLDIFLFYEKIAFRCPTFLSNMTLEQSKNWNIFFQILWKALEKNKRLFKRIMDANLSQYSILKKRKT